MKKSILKIIYIFLFLSIFLGLVTFYIQDANKVDLNSTKEFVVNVVDNKVEYPVNSDVAILNYELNKFFSVFKLIVSCILPMLYYIFFKDFFIKYEKKNKGFFKELVLLTTTYSIFTSMILLPISFFGGFYRTKIIGLGTMTGNAWILSYLENILISIIMGIILYYIPYRIFKNSKKWYIYIPILYIGFTITSAYITPIYIDPLFEKIRPIENEAIKKDIDKLSSRADIENLKVYIVEKGSKTKAINAYMTGILNGKRIVIWDNTIEAISHDELMGVIAHEMGHYKMNHIEKSIMSSCGLIILIVLLANIIINKKKLERNIQTLMILMILLSFFNALCMPIENYISRKMEFQSDEYAIYLTEDKKSSAILEVKLMQKNAGILDVDWWYKIMFCDHPTAKERIDAANNY